MSGLLLTGVGNTGLVARDLGTDLRYGGPWEPHQVAGLAVQVARRLEELHADGRVAGGLDPGHLLLSGDGAVTITTTGAGPSDGDPRFRAPECRGPSMSADWYALGCVLYVLLTAAVPVGNDTARGWSERILRDRPETGDDLARLVGALLSDDPRLRPASARDVEGLLTHPTALRPTHTPPPPARPRRRLGARFRRLTGLGSAATATVVVLGGAVLLTSGAGDDPNAGPAVAPGNPVQAKVVGPGPSVRPRPTATQRPTRNQTTPRPSPTPTPTALTTPPATPAIEQVADPVTAGQAALLRNLAGLLRTDPRAERSRSVRSAAATLGRAADELLANNPATAESSIRDALATLADAQRAGRWQPTAAQSALLAALGYQPPVVTQNSRRHHDS